MNWYSYLECFGAGIFLANFVPHFVNGISGNRFPTPFSRPHGKGLSSAGLNVAWGLFNLLIGFLLFSAAKISVENHLSLIVFFIGISSISIFLSKRFSTKNKN